MKYFLAFFLVLLFSTLVCAQQPMPCNTSLIEERRNNLPKSGDDPNTTLSTEICDNGVDDNGDGLTDAEDYDCYFAQAVNSADCLPSKIAWACTTRGLQWANLETGQEGMVGDMGGRLMDDITWSSDGKLYGIDRNSGYLVQIDPVTANTQFVQKLTPYYAANAITADASGNLYLAAFLPNMQNDIIKVNPATGSMTVIANITKAGIVSGGDLVFLNGILYLSCNSKMAKINVASGAIEVVPIKNMSITAFGMITLGDGYLYLGNEYRIFKVDPLTMAVDIQPAFMFNQYTFILGMSNYVDHCQAPKCKPGLELRINSPEPFCAEKGVLLNGLGTGISGSSAYTWTLPDGSNKEGSSITAHQSGKYFLRYHALPDSCGAESTVDLFLINTPKASLGPDTVLCPGANVNLSPWKLESRTTYTWQDGSTANSFSVYTPGTYSLQATNVCASTSDTILVLEGNVPTVKLGPDLTLCPDEKPVLQNTDRNPGSVKYLWSNGSFDSSLPVSEKGWYWLEANNSCGNTRDSVLVSFKDSCICKPLYPSVNLGNDQDLCKGNEIVLQNSLHKDGFSYQWQDGSTEASFKVSKPGMYWTEVATYCGTVRDTVIVKEKTDGCTCELFVPNAFTPNGDGHNDTFKPISNCPVKMEFILYDRWGEVTFISKDVSKGWDGRIRGILQSSGIYIYQVKYQYDGKPGSFFKKGTVLLIK